MQVHECLQACGLDHHSPMEVDQIQLGLEGCANARVGMHVLEVFLGTIAMLAFGYAGRLASWKHGLASSLAWAVDSTP